MTTISALVAGSFAATQEIARALGEEEFASLSHEGKDESLRVTLVGDRTILATVYSTSTTTAGLVSFYLKQVLAAIRAVLKTVRERTARPALDPGFGEDLGGVLDVAFGDD